LKEKNSLFLFLSSLLTQILVGVGKVGVANRGDDAGLGAPVDADLLEPLEVRRVADALADELLCIFFEFFFVEKSFESERENSNKNPENLPPTTHPLPPSGACAR
jgi:hypothetical protein